MGGEVFRQSGPKPVWVLQRQQVVDHADQSCPAVHGLIDCRPGLDVPRCIEKQQYIAGAGSNGQWLGYLLQGTALQRVRGQCRVGKPRLAFARYRGNDNPLRLAGLFGTD